MPNRALHIAAYDVASPARARQVRRVVKACATGGQKSVFECFLTPAERERLLARVRRLIDEREDRFTLLRVDERAAPVLLGVAKPPADTEFRYVG